MTYNEYKEKRESLMNEAQNLIDEGKLEDSEAKMEEVKDLDSEWDKICKAQANLRALSGNARVQNISDPGKNPEAVGEVIDSTKPRMPGKNEILNAQDAYKSEQYVTAWAKRMMNKKLTAEEENVFQLANEYVHTTENNSMVIPETVSNKIWEEAAELYPYWDDITKTFVPGILTTIQEDESSEAGWYEEDTETEDGKETLKNYTLSGCELSRNIRVSWKLREMSIEDFIPYIQRKMARKLGAALSYGATNGKGKPGANDDFKPEPLGTVTALKKEENTPQVISYTAGEMSYTDVTSAMAVIASGYVPGLAIYANNKTIWNDIANVKDENKRPIFIPDPSKSGVFRVLGVVVKEDGSMNDGDVLFSNAAAGYHANINKQMTVIPEEHVKKRMTDYCGYAIVDGAPITTKAHALLTRKTSSSTTGSESAATG